MSRKLPRSENGRCILTAATADMGSITRAKEPPAVYAGSEEVHKPLYCNSLRWWSLDPRKIAHEAPFAAKLTPGRESATTLSDPQHASQVRLPNCWMATRPPARTSPDRVAVRLFAAPSACPIRPIRRVGNRPPSAAVHRRSRPLDSARRSPRGFAAGVGRGYLCLLGTFDRRRTRRA